MSTFDDGTPSATEETPVEAVPDAAEVAAQIEAAQAQARTEGRAAGYREGFAAGEPVGHAAGRETGLAEGRAQGHKEGLQAGRADAHITSNVEAYKLVAKYPEMMVVPVSAPKAPTPIAMLLPQAYQVWINYVNTWIALKTER